MGYSNLDLRHSGTAEVGSLPCVGAYGSFDMVGNVREWCFNESVEGKRYALGASWRDSAGNSTVPLALDPLERPEDVGFRCAIYDKDTNPDLLDRTPFINRDFLAEHADRQRLYPTLGRLRDRFIQVCAANRIEKLATARIGPHRCETLSLRAGYGPPNERVLAFLLLPDSNVFAQPFQTVIVAPSGPGVFDRSATAEYVVENSRVRSHLAAGRAVLFPVFWGTYQRRNNDFTCLCTHNNPALDRGIFKIANDFSRCVSLLENYNDEFELDAVLGMPKRS